MIVTSMLFVILRFCLLFSEMESRTQGSRPRPRTKKISRPRHRTEDTDASVLKNKVFKNFFQAISKQGLQNFFPSEKRHQKNFFSRRSPLEENKKGLHKFSARFLAFFNKISTVQKIVLSSNRGRGNFRGLEASRPRPRTLKCVLEDVLEAKNVLDDSASGFFACLLLCACPSDTSSSVLYDHTKYVILLIKIKIVLK